MKLLALLFIFSTFSIYPIFAQEQTLRVSTFLAYHSKHFLDLKNSFRSSDKGISKFNIKYETDNSASQLALNYDRDLFDATIYLGFTKFGLYEFYLNIMFPSLERIGFIWSVKSSVAEHENFVSGLLETKINDITKEIIENKVSKDIWLLFIMAPYIFLNRDDNHFISLFETTKMVGNAEKNVVDNWSV